jgi:hypothetical protein
MPEARIWKPKYESDEVAVGVALTIALHALPIAALVMSFVLPHRASEDEDKPLVAKPVIAASLLKLGKPLDPAKLPDRFAPQQRTAPKQEKVASRDDPPRHKPDAGPPPPNAQESDIANLISKSDPFAEDAGKRRPEEGFANGSDAGMETDPSKVREGDEYAAKLGKWFQDRWTIPAFISQGEASRLCVSYRVAIDKNGRLYHVGTSPVKPSGNEHFDESAHEMLQKVMDKNEKLPEPPDSLKPAFLGKSVVLVLSGASGGDSSRCK